MHFFRHTTRQGPVIAPDLQNRPPILPLERNRERLAAAAEKPWAVPLTASKPENRVLALRGLAHHPNVPRRKVLPDLDSHACSLAPGADADGCLLLDSCAGCLALADGAEVVQCMQRQQQQQQQQERPSVLEIIAGAAGMLPGCVSYHHHHSV